MSSVRQTGRARIAVGDAHLIYRRPVESPGVVVSLSQGAHRAHQATSKPTAEAPVLYRASVAEMVVPYGDPSPARFWQNYFASASTAWASSQLAETGCDLPRRVHYFDAVLADDVGRPQVYPNAILPARGDQGVLWKHTDLFTGSDETGGSGELWSSRSSPPSATTTTASTVLYLDGNDPVGEQGNRRDLHISHPGGTTRGPPSSRPAWAHRTTNTCSAPAWT